jgi:hypothetical protein
MAEEENGSAAEPPWYTMLWSIAAHRLPFEPSAARRMERRNAADMSLSAHGVLRVVAHASLDGPPTARPA